MRPVTELELEIEVVKLVGVLAASYPAAQMSDSSINAYVAMLKDIPLQVLSTAVEQSIADSEFLPTIAKLRDRAFAFQSNVAQMPSAFEAWGIVVNAIDRVGFYHTPEFENPIIAKAVGCIGWKDLCCSENKVADRAHFAKVYESIVRQAIEDAKLLPASRQLRERLHPQNLIEARIMN